MKERVAEELSEPPIGSNRSCGYYPCHYDGQECTFCYCPFYPCHDTELGKMKIGRKGDPVWSCKECLLIHDPETVAFVHRELSGGWPCPDGRLADVLSEAKDIFFKR